MNFNDKKTKILISRIIVILLILALIVPTVLGVLAGGF